MPTLNSPLPGRPGRWLLPGRLDKGIVLLVLGVSLTLLVAGLLTKPCLGDEISHYRLAKSIFYAQARVLTDPVYQYTQTGYFYNSEPLWHLGLAAIWKLIGGITLGGAQAYHTLYSALFLAAVWLLAKELYGKKIALLAAMVLASMPLLPAFGILFYTDIPAAALSIMGLWLFFKKRFFLASVLFSAAALTKLTALFFLPAMGIMIFQECRLPLLKRAGNACFLGLPVLAAGWDFFWRRDHMNQALAAIAGHDVTSYQTAGVVLLDRLLLKDLPMRLEGYSNSSLLHLADLLKYFGPAACGLLALYFFNKRVRRVDQRIILPLASYFFFFCYLFHPGADIRYFLPAAPLLAVMAASSAAYFWTKPLGRAVLAGFFILQFGAAVLYIMEQRKIVPGIREGFGFIRQTVPADELIIYPEYVFVEETERGMIWSHRFRDKLGRLFWDDEKQQIVEFLINGRVRYLAVKKNRIYDDSKRKDFGGYPKSFVREVEQLPFFERIFDNKDMSIWRLKKIP